MEGQVNVIAQLAKKHASLIVDDWADLPSAAAAPGAFMRVKNVGYAGADVAEVGGEWLFRNGEIIMAKLPAPITAVVPAATFITYTVGPGSGGRTLISAGGKHGLTAAVSLNKSLPILGGTGWPVGFYEIAAIGLDTDGLTLEVNMPYSGGLGSPVIALPNSVFTFMSVVLPPLLNASVISTNLSLEFSNSAVSKTPLVTLGATDFFAPGITTQDSGSYFNTIQNNNSKAAQVSGINYQQGLGLGSTGGAATRGTVDTTNGATLKIGGKINAANSFMRINSAVVRLIR